MSGSTTESEGAPKLSHKLTTPTDAEKGYLAPSLREDGQVSQDSSDQTNIHSKSEEPNDAATLAPESRGFSIR